VSSRVDTLILVATLILADIGIARLGVNLEPLTFQGEIDGRDFIFGPDCVVGDKAVSSLATLTADGTDAVSLP
jgi:hypothetical protein